MKSKCYVPGATEKQVSEQVVQAAWIYGIMLRRRNTGAGLNPSGKMVRFGEPGDSDFYATIPDGPNRGRALSVEVKRGGFKPPRRGKVRAHFESQLEYLRSENDKGGIAFWISDGEDAMRAFRRIMTVPNLVVEFHGDYPIFVTGDAAAVAFHGDHPVLLTPKED